MREQIFDRSIWLYKVNKLHQFEFLSSVNIHGMFLNRFGYGFANSNQIFAFHLTLRICTSI
jgi:hypothetical protein